MAITSTEEANAVQLLLDYYLRGGAVPSHIEAQEAWMLLAESARNQLGVGWRPVDAGNQFLPRGAEQERQAQRDVRRIVIDADCPYCGWAERWFDPLWQVFGCRKCEYTSQYRNA